MVAVYANCKVLDENVEKFIEVAGRLIAETRKEAGNVSYELVRGTKDPNLFAFVEKWEDMVAMKTHMGTEHFKTIGGELGALMDGRMQITSHEVII